MDKYMKGAILIIGGDGTTVTRRINSILDNLGLNNLGSTDPDVFELTSKKSTGSLGIDDVRGVITFANQKPLAKKNKSVIIQKAHKLTIPAQNALLKTLEELPQFVSIILATKDKNSILETVASRCQILYENKPNTKEISQYNFFNLSLPKRLDLIEDLANKDRDEVIKILEKELSHITQTGNYNVHQIEQTLKLLDNLQNTNVSLKLALEYLALSLEY